MVVGGAVTVGLLKRLVVCTSEVITVCVVGGRVEPGRTFDPVSSSVVVVAACGEVGAACVVMERVEVGPIVEGSVGGCGVE